MTENNPSGIPVLTLNPTTFAAEKAQLEETAQAIADLPAAPSAQAVAQAATETAQAILTQSTPAAAVPEMHIGQFNAPVAAAVGQAAAVSADTGVQAAADALAQMDATLTDEERSVIDSFVKQIDINNTDHVLLFGADAQKKVSEFSESVLEAVRTKDSGEVGTMLTKLVTEIKGFNDTADKPKGLAGLFWDSKKAVTQMTAKFEKVEDNVEAIATTLEGHQVTLLKDVAMFDRLYEINNQYFRELTMYIVAGEKKLQEVRGTTLQELKTKATASGNAMDAQLANDLAAKCDRFEKKLHDLKLTRQVAMQTAPQIRLIQNNDSLLVERIQSTLANTLPLWKSQMVISLGLHRSQEALKAQKAVTDMTNELLVRNAEKLKTGTIETAREAERGIIDLETLVSTNQSLIDTLNEVVKIQDDGRAQRRDAEQKMAQMEAELKKKLLELRH